MQARLALVSALAFVALGTSSALAQVGPPGMCDCAAPPPVAPPAPAEGWDGSKWGIGLRLSSVTFHDPASPEQPTNFGGGGIEIGYRLGARWELTLALGGGQEKLEDGSEGTRQMSEGTLSAKYHLRPYRAWDVVLAAGFGSTAIYEERATDEMREEAAQGHIKLGVAVERRLRRWPVGLSIGLSMVGLAPVEEDGDVAEPTRPGSGVPMPDDVNLDDDDEGVSGGELTLGATYYF
jgi:hypothetical protein